MQLAKKVNFNSKDPLIAIIISIIVASILTVYPVGYAMSAWRPAFMLLVVLFWILCQPAWCGIWFAFGIGLFADLLIEMPFGVNALSFVCLTYAVRWFTREKRIMTMLNLWVIASVAVFAHLLFTWIVLLIIGKSMPLLHQWLPLISSILLCPLLYWCLKRWRAA